MSHRRGTQLSKSVDGLSEIAEARQSSSGVRAGQLPRSVAIDILDARERSLLPQEDGSGEGDDQPLNLPTGAQDHATTNSDPSGTSATDAQERSVFPDEKLLVHAFCLSLLERADQLILIVLTTFALARGVTIAHDLGVDFLFITIIGVMVAVRVFIHKSDLEYQASAATAKDGGIGAANTSGSNPSNDGIRKVWNIPGVIAFIFKPMLPIASAIICAGMSILRLSAKENVLCYSVVLFEAVLYLGGKIYLFYILNVSLKKINAEMQFNDAGKEVLQRLFYAAFCKFIKDNTFEEVSHKMDLFSFLSELLDSGKQDAQLVAVQMLKSCITNDRFKKKTLQNLTESEKAPEQLVKMLSWKSPGKEKEIRLCAAKIVEELTMEKQNAVLRISRIPGVIQTISTLVDSDHTQDGIDGYPYAVLNKHGLDILRNLIKDGDSIEHINNAHDLMLRIINFIRYEQTEHKYSETALHIVYELVISAEGTSGKVLPKAAIEKLVSKLYDILQNAGERQREIKEVAIRVICCLAPDGEARELIRRKMGLQRQLLRIFEDQEWDASTSSLAGEALAKLMLSFQDTCTEMLRWDSDLIQRLFGMLEDKPNQYLTEQRIDKQLRISAAMILGNLCANLPTEQIKVVSDDCLSNANTAHIEVIMEERDDKLLLEVSLGLVYELTSKILKHEKYLVTAGKYSGDEFAKRLVDILDDYNDPDIKVPRMRRFVLQLATWMMKGNPKYRKTFHDHNLESQLENVKGTTSEIEMFHIFSGTVGTAEHRESMATLVEQAYQQLNGVSNASQSGENSVGKDIRSGVEDSVPAHQTNTGSQEIRRRRPAVDPKDIIQNFKQLKDEYRQGPQTRVATRVATALGLPPRSLESWR